MCGDRHLSAVLTKRLRLWPVMLLAWCTCGGCTVVEQVVVDPSPYLLHERGEVKTFRLVHIFHRTSLPLPAPSKSTVALVERAPGGGYPAARRVIEDAPRSRRLAANEADLFVAVDAMTEDAGNAARWIVSNDPIVVAVGAEQTEPKLHNGAKVVDGRIELGMGVRLIAANDLEKKTSELRVLDQWPPPVQLWEPRLRPKPRTVRLSAPTTLRQVLDQSPWKTEPANGRERAMSQPSTADAG